MRMYKGIIKEETVEDSSFGKPLCYIIAPNNKLDKENITKGRTHWLKSQRIC
jgi:hypothetical protein